MTKLKVAELQQLCERLSQQPQPYYNEVSNFLKDSMFTGCRPNELIEIWRWSPKIGSDSKFILVPEKGNAEREILKAGLSANFQSSVINQTNPYKGLSLRQIQISTMKINPAGKMVVGDRNCNTYIYRYNKVCQMRLAGTSWEDIQKFFGWFNPTMPFSYAEREIFVTNPPPWNWH
jgi:hypothetical protein